MEYLNKIGDRKDFDLILTWIFVALVTLTNIGLYSKSVKKYGKKY